MQTLTKLIGIKYSSDITVKAVIKEFVKNNKLLLVSFTTFIIILAA